MAQEGGGGNDREGGQNGACRIISNVRCLSEGIDVPALDAVIFMHAKKSHVDIVQAVGRAMRKSPGKEFGYIILPIAMPADVDEPEKILDKNERFGVVWSVLRALRSHDERFNAEINRLSLKPNSKLPERVKVFTLGGENGTVGDRFEETQLTFFDLPPESMVAKIIENCGDRKYWERWAEDVADIFKRLVMRINNVLDNPDLKEWFDGFHSELKKSINDSITHKNAVDMMAQHILTQPVFDALFEGYNFSANNPISQALDRLKKDFDEFGFENEIEDLQSFYKSIQTRVKGISSSAERQALLKELYETFFATAIKKDAERLGVVYTPNEVVDFILYSADYVLRKEFGRSLSDEGVHILDPFSGTGTFVSRLLQSNLIKAGDIHRKYDKELHANEIILLAYYIAAIHIEEAFHSRDDKRSDYKPFEGMVLTDTFNLTKNSDFLKIWLPKNSERVERQQRAPIQVIVGNPPWSAKQHRATDENPNLSYPELEKRISETYATRSNAVRKSSLYDTYKMAIRWATDRIEKSGGIVAFVTNGSWIDKKANAGIRAYVAEEFSSVYVFDLRGDARLSGERRRAEGGNVFGEGTRSPVAITILVKNSKANKRGIFYYDIGDYKKREEKLEILRDKVSVEGLEGDWQKITPDKHNDWINLREEGFEKLYPMAKEKGREDGIFDLHSLGLATGRDVYIYNFNRDVLIGNASKMVSEYNDAVSEITVKGIKELESITHAHSLNIRWERELKKRLKGGKRSDGYNSSYIKKVMYRPFVPINCYADYFFVNSKYKLDKVFPKEAVDNCAICIPAKGSMALFSTLMVNSMTDLNLCGGGTQCFPRYRYEKGVLQEGWEKVDNITDKALRIFQNHYDDSTITRDGIFNYIYGVLHSSDYRKRFTNSLAKELPRIPFAPDFHIFANAGEQLAELHLGYEVCEEYSLEEVIRGKGELFDEERYKIQTTKMKFPKGDKEKRTLIVNEYISLTGIPEEAHRYVVGGRTPLEWFIDRYYIKTDKESGIVNDPNGWWDDPKDFIRAIKRIVYLSVESARIIESLPKAIVD